MEERKRLQWSRSRKKAEEKMICASIKYDIDLVKTERDGGERRRRITVG